MKLSIISAALLAALAGCSTVGSRVSDRGQPIGEPVFPDAKMAMAPQGAYPDLDKLRQVSPGMTKNQLYDLLDPPHFREGFVGVDRWDYIFHFKTGSGDAVETCRFQILFDKDQRAQSFLWLPTSCADRLKMEMPAPAAAMPAAVPAPMPAPAPVAMAAKPADPAPMAKTPAAPSRMRSMGGVQFAFGHSDLKGSTRALDEIVRQLNAMGGIERIEIVGHADRIGSMAVNQHLSERRARAVSRYLGQHGVPLATVATRGMGKRVPVVECQPAERVVLRRCLAPNRRVEILVWVSWFSSLTASPYSSTTARNGPGSYQS